MAVTAVQSNAQPMGGVTATQPVPTQGNLTPADIQALVESLTPIQQRFRQQSTFLKVTLDQASFTAVGQTRNVKMSNVGLGVRAITEWNLTITPTNAVTSAETFVVNPLWPYMHCQNTQIQINGGATVFSCGGVGAFATMTRQRAGTRRLITSPATAPTGYFGMQVDPALLRVNPSTNLNATNTTTLVKMSGIQSLQQAGSGANTLVATWYEIEKVCLDKDSLLGALPLQNNATFVQIARTIVAALSGSRADLTIPFFTAGADLTFALTTNTADTTYEFASVPDDPSLYQSMIQNSYQIQEQTNNTVTATGVEALVYNIPQNLFLIAATLIGQDGNGVVVNPYGFGPGVVGGTPNNGFTDLKIVYNGGSIIPVVQKAGRERAIAFLDYDYDAGLIPGIRQWDGEATADDVTATDNMGWLDTYSAASPQIKVDIGTSTTTNVTYSTVREAVVAGAVQQIGG